MLKAVGVYYNNRHVNWKLSLYVESCILALFCMKLMKELEAKPITAAEPEPEKAPSTAAAPEHHFHGPIPTTPKAAEPEEPKEEETTTKTRVSSKEIVSDETLELHYFKEGLSVPVIASMYKVGASGLYKRIEAMKAQRKQIEKECARQ